MIIILYFLSTCFLQKNIPATIPTNASAPTKINTNSQISNICSHKKNYKQEFARLICMFKFFYINILIKMIFFQIHISMKKYLKMKSLPCIFQDVVIIKCPVLHKSCHAKPDTPSNSPH